MRRSFGENLSTLRSSATHNQISIVHASPAARPKRLRRVNWRSRRRLRQAIFKLFLNMAVRLALILSLRMPDNYSINIQSLRLPLNFEVSDYDTPTVRVQDYRLSFTPQSLYFLQRLPFSLRNQLPHKDRGQDAHYAIHPIGKPIMEVVDKLLVLIHDREGQ